MNTPNAVSPRAPGVRPYTWPGALPRAVGARYSPVLLLGAALLWSFWPTLSAMAERWAHDPQYSHGWLVPMFAGWLVWSRRRAADGSAPAPWLGVGLLGAAAAGRLAAAALFVPWVEAVMMLPTLAALVVMVGGRPALRRAAPAIFFLIFMIPLPYRVQVSLGGPLQHLAARSTVYVLQTAGVPAVVEGTVVALGPVKVGVAEACSGLGMLVAFAALATGLVMLLRRPWPDTVCLLLSAAPIAVLANIMRITGTAVVFRYVGGEWVHQTAHDLAGLVMMPLALAMFWAEVWALDRLFTPADPEPFADLHPVDPELAGADTETSLVTSADITMHDPRRTLPTPDYRSSTVDDHPFAIR